MNTHSSNIIIDANLPEATSEILFSPHMNTKIIFQQLRTRLNIVDVLGIQIGQHLRRIDGELHVLVRLENHNGLRQ